MVISEINIVPIPPQNGILAFASGVIENSFHVGGIAIYTCPGHTLGHRLVFPTKKLSSGRQIPCFYPIRKDVEEEISKAIIEKYIELMDSFQRVE